MIRTAANILCDVLDEHSENAGSDALDMSA